MADLKISQLTAKGTAIASTDLIEISESDGAGGSCSRQDGSLGRRAQRCHPPAFRSHGLRAHRQS